MQPSTIRNSQVSPTLKSLANAPSSDLYIELSAPVARNFPKGDPSNDPQALSEQSLEAPEEKLGVGEILAFSLD